MIRGWWLSNAPFRWIGGYNGKKLWPYDAHIIVLELVLRSELKNCIDYINYPEAAWGALAARLLDVLEVDI